MKKIIVTDFDNTLAFEKSSAASDIPTAEPNVPLIEQLNRLYDSGYEIHIYTARGCLSAKSRKDADFKYRDVIETWLHKYNVKYTLLSFDKPLAIYYIDDKAIRPDELRFLESL